MEFLKKKLKKEIKKKDGVVEGLGKYMIVGTDNNFFHSQQGNKTTALKRLRTDRGNN